MFMQMSICVALCTHTHFAQYAALALKILGKTGKLRRLGLGPDKGGWARGENALLRFPSLLFGKQTVRVKLKRFRHCGTYCNHTLAHICLGRGLGARAACQIKTIGCKKRLDACQATAYRGGGLCTQSSFN